MMNTAWPALPSACSRSSAMARNARTGGTGSNWLTSGATPEGTKRCSIWIAATFSRSGAR